MVKENTKKKKDCTNKKKIPKSTQQITTQKEERTRAKAVDRVQESSIIRETQGFTVSTLKLPQRTTFPRCTICPCLVASHMRRWRSTAAATLAKKENTREGKRQSKYMHNLFSV